MTVDVKMIGHRPSGETPKNAPLVQCAIEASQALGIRPLLNRASTDANIPIALGIPAVTIDAGGNGSGAHSIGEWYDDQDRGSLGVERILLLVVLALD